MGWLEDVLDNTAELFSRLPQFGDGIWTTLQLAVLGSAGAFVIAVILGVAGGARLKAVRGIARVIVEFFRGTSLLVQMFWLFFVLPQFGIELPPLATGVIALAMNYGAYAAEVVRGSIASVPKGQYEAVNALSLSPLRGMFRVIFPQAWALMIPSLTNLLIQLLKGSAVVTFITLTDLNYQIEELRRDTGTLYAYVVGLLAYFLIAYAMTLVMNALEIRAKHQIGRGPSLRASVQSVFRPVDTASGSGGKVTTG